MSAKSTSNKSGSHTNWKRLHKMHDKDINYTDIPETSSEFWENAEVVIPPPKIHLSVRFDSDVVDFFKTDGVGYQTRMNAVLRSYMKSCQKK